MCFVHFDLEMRFAPQWRALFKLTLLSEPTRKVAVFELSKLRNGASATPKQQGPEGRTEPADNGPNCLTLLSETKRRVAIF